MSRARLTVAFLLATSLGAGVSAGPAAAFRFTHQVSVTGKLVDHWTVNDPNDCGPVGDGTVTVTYQTKKAARAEVLIDPAHNGAGNHLGSWALLAPQGPFKQITDLAAQKASATVTRVDNTSPRPQPGGDCGGPPDKSGCGTTPLGSAMSMVGGYDRQRLIADLRSDEFNVTGGARASCQIGALDLFSSPPSLAGGTRRGELLLKMPSPKKLAHRRVVQVSGTSHKLTSSGDPGSTAYTDDVTRSVTVTFKRL